MAPSGRHKQSKGENLELLLATQSPNSEVTEEMMDPAAATKTNVSTGSDYEGCHLQESGMGKRLFCPI